MKKLLLSLILFTSVCQGQDNVLTEKHVLIKATNKKSHFFISLNAGMSVPLNDYSTRTKLLLPNQTEGYASTGTQFNMFGGVFLTPQIALIAKAGLDENNLNQPLFSANIGDWPSGSFKIWQYMGGVYYHVKLSPRIFLSAQAMFGLISGNYPSYSISDDYIEYRLNFKNGTGLGYLLGVGFEKLLTQTIGLVGRFSYTAGQINYPIPYDYVYRQMPQTKYTSIIMTYGSMQATAGVSFHL